jgi:hypothetical protein
LRRLQVSAARGNLWRRETKIRILFSKRRTRSVEPREMKAKLTVTVEEELIPEAKRYAHSRGTSLSQLIEGSLREMMAGSRPSFSQRWRGQFRAAEREDDERYNALAKKYLS